MIKRILPCLIFFCLVSGGLLAQSTDIEKIRTIDGRSNNLENTRWGAAGDNLQRHTDVGYVDGISIPGGTDRPNPREISNQLFAQEGLINDPMNLSDFCWVFGQFIDHDIGMTPDGNEPLMIRVPQGDQWFDPMGSGQVMIPMMRNRFDPATGTGTDNPRQHPNMITAFIDGSAVYGSDESRAAWLRTFQGGKLKTSSGNLLPFNTTTGELDGAIDPSAPHMDDPVGISDKHFVAGDVRANENPLLLSFHTLFVREHNRKCNELARLHPDWSDEELYQYARKYVGGTIQSVVYNEWLPTMGVHLSDYQGYKPDVNPQLMNVFTAAAFRLGHTLLNSQIRRLNNDGDTIALGNMTLREAFFNPMSVIETGGIDPFFKGMATQTQQSMDPKVIDDVRNFLFGPPGAGGLDLASININRGRERGLPDYNTVRRNFGLQPYYFFQQISYYPQIVSRLSSLYKNIHNIDPWVGMLSETPARGELFGETIMQIMIRQFTDLRDGDRFFYLNDPVLSEADKKAIHGITLHDVIMRNTGIELMQDNVFEAMPHSSICENMIVEVNGQVYTEAGDFVQGVEVTFRYGENTEALTTGKDGLFDFLPVPGCEVRELSLAKNDLAANGLSTLDLILIQKHILDIKSLESPYKIIAADANMSGNVSTLDIVLIRKIILGITNSFDHEVTWRFIPADYVFADPSDPFEAGFPETLEFTSLGQDLNLGYIAVKVGDVNNSAQVVESFTDAVVENRNEQPSFDLALENRLVSAGESVTLFLTAAQADRLQGYQFSIGYDREALDFQGIEPGEVTGVTDDNFAAFPAEGLLNTSWNTPSPVEVEKGAPLFGLNFQVMREGRLRDWIRMTDAIEGVAYGADLASMPVRLVFEGPEEELALQLELYQNQPNPFRERTVIPFSMPEAGNARLTVFDVNGRVLLTRAGQFDQGMNEWTLQQSEITGEGVLYYRLDTDSGSATRKMLRVR